MPNPCSHFPKKLPTERGFQNHSQPSNKAKHPSKQTSPLQWEGSWSWPGLEAAESSPAGHSKAQIVWQGLVPADRAQISGSQKLTGNRNAASWEQSKAGTLGSWQGNTNIQLWKQKEEGIGALEMMRQIKPPASAAEEWPRAGNI